MITIANPRSRIFGGLCFVLTAIVEAEIAQTWIAFRERLAQSEEELQPPTLVSPEIAHDPRTVLPPPDGGGKGGGGARRVRNPGTKTGIDKAGREADFFYVVSREFHWKKGGVVIQDAAGREIPMEAYLATPGLQNHLSYPGIVAVGTASCEDEGGRPPARRKEWEENRSLTRGEILVQKLRTALPKTDGDGHPPKLYLLSLGQFKDSDCGATDTNRQRMVALVAITWRQEGVNIEEALRYALDDRRLLGFDPRSYSLWPSFFFEDRTSGSEPWANKSPSIASMLSGNQTAVSR